MRTSALLRQRHIGEEIALVLEHPIPYPVSLTRASFRSRIGGRKKPRSPHTPGLLHVNSGSRESFVMEQYDDTFEPADDVPTIKEIERRLRRLGCTNEQVSRHLEQVTKGRTKPAPARSKNRPHRIDWP